MKCGGSVRFGTRVDGLIREDSGAVGGVLTSDGEIRSQAVVLATGHGARDVFQWMDDQGFPVERKPFALGVRV